MLQETDDSFGGVLILGLGSLDVVLGQLVCPAENVRCGVRVSFLDVVGEGDGVRAEIPEEGFESE